VQIVDGVGRDAQLGKDDQVGAGLVALARLRQDRLRIAGRIAHGHLGRGDPAADKPLGLTGIEPMRHAAPRTLKRFLIATDVLPGRVWPSFAGYEVCAGRCMIPEKDAP